MKFLPICLFALFAACASPTTTHSDPLVPDGFRRLLAASTTEPLEGWTILGKASFDVAFVGAQPDGAYSATLTGKAENMRLNSFLVSDDEFANFELLVDVRIEPGGNSGIQIRSHVNWNAQKGHGRLWGYQIEIDPSERAWSGGLYDEGRRGWLANLEERPEARAAFLAGEWNQYRILCEDARIRTWVNGVAAVDFLDAGQDLDLSGHIAFQVHNGKGSFVQWRNPVIRAF